MNFFITLLAITIFVACSQNPSPIFMRGEEFYGKRELEDHNEYYYTSDNAKKNIPGEIILKNFDISEKSEPIKNICKFIYPIKNSPISTLNNNTDKNICNEGTLFVTDIGKDIIASAKGKVLYIGKGLRWYGNLIILEHDENIMTMYYYIHNINVKVGDKVEQGQTIASIYKINNHIENNKPYMCFSIHSNGKALDALKHINSCQNIYKPY